MSNIHTYTWAGLDCITWKEAGLLCCQDFALPRRVDVNCIIFAFRRCTPPPLCFNKSKTISSQQAVNLI